MCMFFTHKHVLIHKHKETCLGTEVQFFKVTVYDTVYAKTYAKFNSTSYVTQYAVFLFRFINSNYSIRSV